MATCSGPVEDFTKFIPVFATIGGLTVVYAGLKALCGLYHLFSTFISSTIPDLKKYGSWAVVTGATDGIGKAYAQELARKGLNIVLISRTREKLQDVAAELETINSGIKTKIIAVDFTKGWDLKDSIRAGLQGLDIGILVNNVGMGYPHPEFYLEVSEQTVRDIMACNMTSVLMMTRLCMPEMLNEKKGLIINISSASGFRPTPMLSIYSATKVFVDYFTDATNKEYNGRGIEMQCVMPFFVATKLSKIRRASFFVPSAIDFARSALATVGRAKRTTGYLTHEIQSYVSRFIPEWLIDRYVMKLFLARRRQALKRTEEKKSS